MNIRDPQAIIPVEFTAAKAYGIAKPLLSPEFTADITSSLQKDRPVPEQNRVDRQQR